MARKSGLSQTMVSRIWRAFALQPHRVESFKLSTAPLLVEQVRELAGLYLNPADRALVLCVDEKAQLQALVRPDHPAGNSAWLVPHRRVGAENRRLRRQLQSASSSLRVDRHRRLHLRKASTPL